jgi:hypothetical protein
MCDGYDQANTEIAADVLRLEISRARDAYGAALKAYSEASGDPWSKWSEDLARAEQHWDTLRYALDVLEEDYLDEKSYD